MISRRRLLASLGYLTGAALMPDPGEAVGRSRRIIGLQLYTLGASVGRNPERALRRVKDIGYGEVELPQFYGQPPRTLRGLLDRTGLACPSVHVPLRPLLTNAPSLESPGAIAEALHVIGARYVVVPIVPFPSRFERMLRTSPDFRRTAGSIARAMTMDDWRRLADELNDKGGVLARFGLKLCYHNHNLEFVEITPGRTAYDVIAESTDPRLVGLELDVGWVAAAGVDPVALFQRYAKRVPLMHLKDLRPTPPNEELEMDPCDVGAGIIPWRRLLSATEHAGVGHYFLEQEAPFARGRFEASDAGFRFLRRTLASIDT